jgi:hypothetical protein
MIDAAAFRATFSDFKLIKTRKVAQFIFEVPVEQVDAALKVLGGMPRADAEAWVGIARLTGPKAASETSVAPNDAKARYDAGSEGDKAVARSAILCKDNSFHDFLCERYADVWSETFDSNDDLEEIAKKTLCSLLGVNSRKVIAFNPVVLNDFTKVEAEYRDWNRARV